MLNFSAVLTRSDALSWIWIAEFMHGMKLACTCWLTNLVPIRKSQNLGLRAGLITLRRTVRSCRIV